MHEQAARGAKARDDRARWTKGEGRRFALLVNCALWLAIFLGVGAAIF